MIIPATWILILTLTNYSDGGVTVSSILGFENQKSCMVAANAWVRQVNDRSVGRRHAALCVRTR